MFRKIKTKGRVVLFLFSLFFVASFLIMKSDFISADCTSVCLDFDEDGRGNPASLNCDIPGVLDCDDTNPGVWASVAESSGVNCDDGVDNDCDGLVDCADDDCVSASNCVTSCIPSCSDCFALGSEPTDSSVTVGDCCNVAQGCYDCDFGFTWNGLRTACVADCIDNDGDRNIQGTVNVSSCGNVCGLLNNESCLNNNDCDDTDRYIFQGNPETCDGKNNDCAGGTDDGCDDDGDGYCDETMMVYDSATACPNSSDNSGAGLIGDDCDDTVGTGATINLGVMVESCDETDHDCDGDYFNGVGLESCPLACDVANVWTGSGGTSNCCGNDIDEGGFGTNVFQVGNELLPTDRCGDGVDNDCSGTCDSTAGACYAGSSLPDSNCTGSCNDTGENDWTNAATPGVCDQCSVVGDQDIDSQDAEDWSLFPSMVDQCDADCATVSVTVARVNYENGVEASCDGIDNNCDGGIDTGLTPGLTSNQTNLCSGAVQTCTGVGGWVDDYTIIADYEATETLCDTLDNDCDGTVDEGCSACVPTVPSTEVCDGADNDCDGNTDNGLTPGLTSNQTNLCSGSVQTCTGVGGWVDDYTIITDYEATETLCDTLDNDCDGTVDEGCSACVPTVPSTEVCDGVDNDCDGNTDNGLTPGLTSNQTNLCSGAVQTCTGVGGWVDDYTIITDYEATETLCDTLDNDCDGTVDEGCISMCTFPLVFPCTFP